MPVDEEFPGNRWGEVDFLAVDKRRSGCEAGAVGGGRPGSVFTHKRQRKNKQFHGRLRTVTHNLAQSQPSLSLSTGSFMSACVVVSPQHPTGEKIYSVDAIIVSKCREVLQKCSFTLLHSSLLNPCLSSNCTVVDKAGAIILNGRGNGINDCEKLEVGHL